MKWMTVVEYDKADVRSMGAQGPEYIAGDPVSASVVFARDPDEAIRQVASEAGFYSAHALELSPREFNLIEAT